MIPIYLVLNIGVILFPFVLSFDKKVAFYKKWKQVFKSIIFTALIFIPWDIYFTYHGVWGFNEDYLIGISIFHLPIEEILFFITVPYAFLFILACIEAYFPAINKQSSIQSKSILLGCIALLSIVLSFKFNGWYSLSVYIGVPIIASMLILSKSFKLIPFIISFAILLLPFFIVNGILTGGYTEAPIVWYDDLNFSNIRFGSIPMEDLFYNFILCGLLVLFKKD